MAKKFVFRGYDLEQLQQMPMEEFLKLVPTKMRRSMTRMGSQFKKFLEKFRHHVKKSKEKPMRTHFRQMVILPEMVGTRFQVYNGNSYVDFTAIIEMLGHRLGEFSHTNKLVRHSGPGIGATRGSKSVDLK